MDRREQAVTVAVEVEHVLALVIEVIPPRDKLDLGVDRAGLRDEDLDVRDVDDVLAVHQLHADDRRAADGGRSVGLVYPRLEDVAVHQLDEVGLVGLRLAGDEVLDNLVLEVKAVLLHLRGSHLHAVLGT
ncbi:MAG: hypothetical protein IKW89_04895, partial [Bacteroidales bacterium]|nr:hypothetical protein [Bacteroidales bacterium]